MTWQRQALANAVALPIDHIEQRCISGAGDQIGVLRRGSDARNRPGQQDGVDDPPLCFTEIHHSDGRILFVIGEQLAAAG